MVNHVATEFFLMHVCRSGEFDNPGFGAHFVNLFNADICEIRAQETTHLCIVVFVVSNRFESFVHERIF